MTRVLFTCLLMTSLASMAGVDSELRSFAEEALLLNGPENPLVEAQTGINNGQFLVDPNFVFFRGVTGKSYSKMVVEVYFKQEPGESKEDFEAKNNCRFDMHKMWIPTFKKIIADAQKDNRKLLFNADKLALRNDDRLLLRQKGKPLNDVFAASDYFISLKQTIVDISHIRPLFSRHCCFANPVVGFKIGNASFQFKYLPASWVEKFNSLSQLKDGTQVKVAMRLLENARLYKDMPAELVFEVVDNY